MAGEVSPEDDEFKKKGIVGVFEAVLGAASRVGSCFQWIMEFIAKHICTAASTVNAKYQ